MKHAAVGIISKKIEGTKKYLLVSSVLDYGEFTGYYYPPGGHIPNGSDIEKVLISKIKKELFIDIEPISEIAANSSDIKNQIIHWWLCKAEVGKLIYDKKRLTDAKWFSEEEIKKATNIWPATKKFFQNYIFKTS